MTEQTDKTKSQTKRQKRLREAFIFLGAALVLGSFIVKDAIRDRLKDLSDEIELAQSRYLTSHDASEILRTLTDPVALMSQRSLKSTQMYRGFRLSLRRRQISNTWDLVAEFPDTPDKADLAQSMIEMNQILDKGVYPLRERFNKYEEDALAFAKKRKEEIERRYNIFTKLSYVLYCAAVVFGVVAKLSGFDIAGE